jgi:hypothetical protein
MISVWRLFQEFMSADANTEAVDNTSPELTGITGYRMF